MVNRFKIKISIFVRTPPLTRLPGLGEAQRPACLLTYVVFHFGVMFVHELKESHFYLGLIQKSLLVLYDFNGNPFLLHTIICFYNLKEKKEE